MSLTQAIFSPHDTGMSEQSAPLSDFEIHGHSSQCSSVIDRKEHLLIGISPFNSRFSPNYVESLLNWGLKTFSQVDILLPDENSAAALLTATGDSPNKAARKARKELNRHRRALERIFSRIGERSSRTRVIDFSDYFHHKKYTAIKTIAQETFQTCEKFRAACLNMSLQAIRGRTKVIGSQSEDLEACKAAVSYIFAELPFYLCTAELLEANTSVLAYHRKWPIGDALMAGEFPFSVDPRQGHGIVSIVTPEKKDAQNDPFFTNPTTDSDECTCLETNDLGKYNPI